MLIKKLNKFKKVFAVACAATMLCQFAPATMSASAATTPEVSYVVTGDPVVGNTVQIAVNASGLTSTHGSTVDFVYDSTVLKIQSIELGDLFGTGKEPTVKKNIAGSASVGLTLKGSEASCTKTSGTLAVIKAEVLKADQTVKLNTTPDYAKLDRINYTVAVKLADKDSNKINYTFKNSSFVTKGKVDPTDYLTVGKYSNTEAKLNYTGNWVLTGDKGQRYTTQTGAALSFTFEGTGLNIYTISSNNKGIAEVYIDDVKYDADNYSGATINSYLFSKGGLSNGKHTVKVVASGRKNAASTGTVISIAGVEILGENSYFTEAGRYENIDPRLQYSGKWTLSGDKSQTYSGTAGDSVSFTFDGVGFMVISTAFTNRGISKVYVDGKAYNADGYSNKLVNKSLFAINNLPNGKHTVKIEVTNQKNAAANGTLTTIDAIKIYK